MKLTGKFERNTVRLFDGQTLYGSIDFSAERAFQADIFVYSDRFHVGPKSETDKDLVVTKGDKALFAFRFDKLWGGAEIESQGHENGYEVKGRWFKPGTRLIDQDDKDLVTIVSHETTNSVEVTVFEKIEPVMVLSALYYHLYASGSKTFSAILGAAII
ncbi:hypothetical protein [Flavobacterium sp.]|uniref:hypothetical protein n=1 Tax=Flavobacterium sp. TaxID=239 RepID=UPI0011FB3FEF|nr:hypothetical protein [Flavobacterium sp.]RZJ73520.1 MAG: hypothetical protein EOO49_01525 [Flavobacterium sp.]